MNEKMETMNEKMNENMIEMKTITNEEKLDILFKNNPLLEKVITNEYEKRLYDYYRLAEELLLLIKKRILLITNYSKLENTKVARILYYNFKNKSGKFQISNSLEMLYNFGKIE
jgi:hypothetical protein